MSDVRPARLRSKQPQRSAAGGQDAEVENTLDHDTALLAFGIDLTLTSRAEGGRTTPLIGGQETSRRFQYRPNWGLPGWPDGEQTAGPVLGFSRREIAPADEVQAVFVALFVEHAPWSTVGVGDVLRMYEGARVCGVAKVRWVERCTWSPAEEQMSKWDEWLDAQGS